MFQPSTVTVLSQLVARDVAVAIEIGREYGYRYPTTYDVGFVLVEDEAGFGLCRCQVRVDDQRHRFVATWLMVDNGDSFLVDLQRGASTCVHLWAERHPDYQPTPQCAGAAIAQMNRERAELGEDGYAAKIAALARTRVMAARFELRKAGLDA